MSEELTEQVLELLGQAAELYSRLVLVVAPVGGGKTAALLRLSGSEGYPYINVNLELGGRLLELSQRQRAAAASRMLAQIVDERDGQILLLDNTELLFEVSLRLDPLRLLQGLGRNRTIVTAWSGTAHAGHLVYAAPGHPEYRRYPTQPLLIATPSHPVDGTRADA